MDGTLALFGGGPFAANDDLDRAFASVRAIVEAERLRRDRRPGLFDFVNGLLTENPF